MTRFQQYSELLEDHDYEKAVKCSQNYLIKFLDINFDDLEIAFAFNHFFKKKNYFVSVSDSNNNNNNTSFSKTNYSINNQSDKFFKREKLAQCLYPLGDKNWIKLNELYLDEYYSRYGIPGKELLLIYLSLGISALKTKAHFHDRNASVIEQYCNLLHSIYDNININEKDFDDDTKHKPTIFNKNTTDAEMVYNVCPICNSSFKNISENLPVAHHTESKLFESPEILPNGNVYDAERLKLLAGQLRVRNLMQLQEGEIFDPIDKQIYLETDFVKMYPT